MEIKKLYSYSNKKQIWRLLPTQTGKLIIEERDFGSKEVFFTCLDTKTGKKIFDNFQIEEKFWVGIEEIYKDIIFFHKFRKPDMPGHLGIIAFDINTKNILWKNDEYIFLFIHNDGVYCYKEKFEGRNFHKLDYLTGKLLADLGDNVNELNSLREKKLSENNLEYHFTNQFNPDSENVEIVRDHLSNIRSENLVSGKIDYINYSGILFYNFHEILQSGGEMKNIFRAVDIESGKVIFEEELNSRIKVFVPDSFFIINDLLFLLKEKTGFITCSINE
jgi:Domain of unknown function (DUF4905)